MAAEVQAVSVSQPEENIKHYVVIIQENHSFDSRFGGWEGVNGLNNTFIPQTNMEGVTYACLPQTKRNLRSPDPLPVTCIDSINDVRSAFENAAFNIADYQPSCQPNDEGCDIPLISMVHRFYQEQYQINGGKMDRFVTASNATGATVHYTQTQTLPLYQYLHDNKSTLNYVVLDNYFHAAFGGSFLNHQWLITANTPVWKGALNDGSADDMHSVIDRHGMPCAKDNGACETPPYYKSPDSYALLDSRLTVSCNPAPNRGATPAGVPCGDFVINTAQPYQQPFHVGTPDSRKLPALDHPTIGDRLNSKGVSWAWYSGGWSNANGDAGKPGWTNGRSANRQCEDPNTETGAQYPYCANNYFSFHHQPFNYFKSFDRTTRKGKTNRARHLRDEAEFIDLAHRSKKNCKLRQVSFVKPLTSLSEHSTGGNYLVGNQHATDLIKAVEDSACAKDTLVILTFDENGGEYDHVAPPGSGDTQGPHDEWGPGTRIPTLMISPLLPSGGSVDSTQYDSTSILATLERRYKLNPVGKRDAAVNDLFASFRNARPLPAP